VRLVLIKANLFAPISVNVLITIEHLFYIILTGIVKLLLSVPNKSCKFSSLSSILILPKKETSLRLGLFFYCYLTDSHYFPWVPMC
jgi:hypothetical protein